MQDSRTIMGLENELTVGVAAPGKRPRLPQFMKAMIDVLHRKVPSVTFVEAPGSPPGLMMGSTGGRLYIDGASYFESATPEATRPEEVLAYQRAQEMQLLEAATEAAEICSLGPEDVTFSRVVTDYAPETHYCGQHLNISLRRYTPPELVAFLLPFLATRYYAAAGGWGSAGWVMTQKNASVHCATSLDTRQNRGLFNLRDEPLGTATSRRLHLTHGDATMAELGTYLTVGCSALVTSMLDHGVFVGPAYTLDDPVNALRQLDHDPSWTRPLRLASGREASALEIQDHYLKAAERYTRRHIEPWMRHVVKSWRSTQDTLRKDPALLETALDPYIKRRCTSGSWLGMACPCRPSPPGAPR